MLLERIDELPLASHDLRGNPSALLGSIVGRIDRLKDELVTAEDYAAWAATLPEETEPDRARAAREREFAAIYAAHDRMLAEAGTLDYGDLVVHAFRLLRDQAARARAARRPLRARARRRLPGHELRPDAAAAAARRRARPRSPSRPTTTRRSRRFRGASTKGIADFRADWPDATVVPPRGVAPRRRSACSPPPAR